MNIALISHPECLLHDIGAGFPEKPERIHVINQALGQSSIANYLIHYMAPHATKEALKRVHDEEYIDSIFKISPKEGIIELDPDTWMNPFSLGAALYAAGSSVYAVDLVMSQKEQSVFCNIRPPGHHAEKSRAMGFCIFNNVAVGVAHAIEVYGLKRILIVDFDAHHGNGIENIFLDNPKVLYCSSFEHPFYPYSGADTKPSNIINIPLAAGSSSQQFRQLAQQYWFNAIRDFQPELVFFAAGFDAYYKDTMSNLLFKEEDYGWITREILNMTGKSSDYRTISLLEGGYDLENLGHCVVHHLTEIVNARSLK